MVVAACRVGRKSPGRPAVPERDRKERRKEGAGGGAENGESGREGRGVSRWGGERACLWVVLHSILPKAMPQLAL